MAPGPSKFVLSPIAVAATPVKHTQCLRSVADTRPSMQLRATLEVIESLGSAPTSRAVTLSRPLTRMLVDRVVAGGILASPEASNHEE